MTQCEMPGDDLGMKASKEAQHDPVYVKDKHLMT